MNVTIKAAHAASPITIDTDVFADVRRITSGAPALRGDSYLLAPMSDDRILVAHEPSRAVYTVNCEGEVEQVQREEQFRAAQDALANTRQLFRYHEGRVVSVNAKHMQPGVAAMRYQVTMAYLMYWFQARILTETWEHIPAHKLLGRD